MITNLFNINILTFTDTVFTINYSFIIRRNYLKKKKNDLEFELVCADHVYIYILLNNIEPNVILIRIR